MFSFTIDKPLKAKVQTPTVVPEPVQESGPAEPAMFAPSLGQVTAPIVKPVSPAAEAKTELEEQLGEHVSLVSHYDLAAMRDGVIVHVSIHRWRATAGLKLEELGISDSETQVFSENFIALGRKYLLPKDLRTSLDSAESAARKALTNAGFRTGLGWFVPSQRFHIFKEAFVEAQTNFNNAIEKVCINLEEVRAFVKKEYETLAEKAWLAARKTWEGGSWDQLDSPPSSFVDEFVSRVVAQIPSAEEIRMRSQFGYRLELYVAPDTKILKHFANSSEELSSELLEYAQAQKKQLVDDFLFAARDGLAGAIKDFADSIRDGLKTRAHVHGKTIKAILNKIEDFRSLNVINDETLSHELGLLEGFVKAYEGEKLSAEETKIRLQRVADKMAEVLKKDLAMGSPFVNIGV